jgi:hypothetical protein
VHAEFAEENVEWGHGSQVEEAERSYPALHSKAQLESRLRAFGAYTLFGGLFVQVEMVQPFEVTNPLAE